MILKTTRKSILILVMAVYLLVIGLSANTAVAEEGLKGIIDGSNSINVRKDAGNDQENARAGGVYTTVKTGDEVLVIGKKTGPSSHASKTWYKITYETVVKEKNVTVVGFVHSDYVIVQGDISKIPNLDENSGGSGNNSGTEGNPGETGSGSSGGSTGTTNTTFEEELKKFPESYQKILKELHKSYPNWHFTAYNTGLTWDEAVAGESEIGHSLIDKNSNPLYINQEDVDEEGNQRIRDGNNWVTASKAAVEYYMDPRNFLTTRTILAFENLTYEGYDKYSVDGVQSILNKTFMKGSYTYKDENGKSITKTYAETFIEAGKISNVNPYHLAAKCRIEQGTNGNYIGNGIYPGYEGYYNFFNIGAYSHDGRGANHNGAIYAATEGKWGRPWDNQYKAIIGGSTFVGSSYINAGQNTLYFERFNVVNKDKLYKHEYSTNVSGAISSASSMKAAYPDETFNGSLSFIIPVYKNMPKNLVAKPEDRKEGDTDERETGGGSGSTGSSGNSGTEVEQTVKVSYQTNKNILYGVAEDTTVAAFKKKFTLSDGLTLIVYDKNGNEKNSGTIFTSDSVKVVAEDNSVVVHYDIATLGDLNGDGIITIADLVSIRKHLLGLSTLSEENFRAGDANKDGQITIADLVAVRKHLLAIAKLV